MRVGRDIGAICRKCGDVWHVVVAVVDARIAKVECKQCGGRHAYRAAAGEADAAPRRRTTAKARTRKSPTVVEADLSRPARPYRASDRYEAGDRVLHPSFGEGVVQAIAGPTKVHVLFAGGPRTLVHARASSG